MQINLRDDLKVRLAERAAENGFPSIEAYVESLLRADAGDDQVISDADMEQLLLQRMDSGPGVELTPAFVEQFKQRRD